MAVGHRNLDALFRPRSVAVIGASAEPGKWGHEVAKAIVTAGSDRPVHFVNPKGSFVVDRAARRSLAELPEVPELAVLCIANRFVDDTVEEALEMGVKGFVLITIGFGETSADGARRQARIAQRIRDAGGLLVGPNCMGLFDGPARLHCLPFMNPRPGTVTAISHSGSILADIDSRLLPAGLGFSRAVSLGNTADVSIGEVIRYTASRGDSAAIALYCEDFRDGRDAFRAAIEAADAGTPVVVLSAGVSEASFRAAQSHTGALLTDRSILEATCEASGVVLAGSLGELAAAVTAIASRRRTAGRRIAIVSEGGGAAVLAAEAVTRVGLEIPMFGDELSRAISSELSYETPSANPVDLVGMESRDPMIGVMKRLMDTDEVDAILFSGEFTGSDAAESTSIGNQVADAAETGDKPVIFATVEADGPGARALRERGFAVFRDLEAAAQGVAAVSGRGALVGIPVVEPPAAGSEGPLDTTYHGVREFLGARGVTFGAVAETRTLEETLQAAERLGYPIVLKALGMLHKSDAGGVILGIEDAGALEAAWSSLDARLAPPSYSVERMLPAEDSVDLIFGTRSDPRFGPILLVGIGGIFVEILDDKRVALAPTSPEQVEAMIRSLRGAALLTGARGRPPLDVAAAARAGAALSEVAAAYPQILTMEVNPVRVHADGATALDARMVLVEGAPTAARADEGGAEAPADLSLVD